MDLFGIIIAGLYLLGMLGIFLYTLAQAQLALNYLFSHRNGNREKNSKKDESLTGHSRVTDGERPMVTIQLPVYNEKYVVERLIDAVAAFRWPAEKMEIQVLDDSSDETVDIIADKVFRLRREGYNIEHMRRDTREGFKAGALQYGLEKSNGDFIAIFDADFVPKPDFLLQTIPRFRDEDIGLVQTRWGHLNENYSLLTKTQAFALDAHFTVEQAGRNSAGLFMNFNGTAGVWRKECIREAGGWHHDTLTEDLDLSYRAQLKGWRFRYLEDVVSPAELPVTVSALKNQQHRWMKGAAETARKHLSQVWNTKLPFIQKVHATTHLLNSGIFLFILLIALTSVPLLFVTTGAPETHKFMNALSFFLSGLLLWVFFYSLPYLRKEKKITSKLAEFAVLFPTFLSLSMGLSLHNSLAVIKGYLGRQSPFLRTPKFNITGVTGSWKSNSYLNTRIEGSTLFEGFLALYFLGGIAAAFALDNYGMVAFHLLLFAGFGILFGNSLYERIARPS